VIGVTLFHPGQCGEALGGLLQDTLEVVGVLDGLGDLLVELAHRGLILLLHSHVLDFRRCPLCSQVSAHQGKLRFFLRIFLPSSIWQVYQQGIGDQLWKIWRQPYLWFQNSWEHHVQRYLSFRRFSFHLSWLVEK
jgi:hypothetical protein